MFSIRNHSSLFFSHFAPILLLTFWIFTWPLSSGCHGHSHPHISAPGSLAFTSLSVVSHACLRKHRNLNASYTSPRGRWSSATLGHLQSSWQPFLGCHYCCLTPWRTSQGGSVWVALLSPLSLSLCSLLLTCYSLPP